MSEKCRGILCANCTEQYCEVVLDMEIGEDIFEECDMVSGEVGMFEEVEVFVDWVSWVEGNVGVVDCRKFDYYEGCWRV